MSSKTKKQIKELNLWNKLYETFEVPDIVDEDEYVTVNVNIIDNEWAESNMESIRAEKEGYQEYGVCFY